MNFSGSSPAEHADNGVLPGPTAMLARLLERIAAGSELSFRAEFTDGSVVARGSGAPEFTLRFHSSRAARRVLALGYVGLLESYFDGSVDVDGDLAAAFRAGLASGLDTAVNPFIALRNKRHEWRFSNASVAQAKANARFHYGLGQDFYRPWLDVPSMTYTCAYWKEGTRTLEEAQRNKMDHVCRKVQLKAGDTFVDVGSGWGGLLLHAWEHYRAVGTGINTTTEQVAESRAEIARRGLADRLHVFECDFREIPGQYDKLLSIGTLEHAGRDQLADVVRAHAAALKPGGLGVIHFIGHVDSRDTEFYIREYIFPGGWIPSLAEAITCMERNGLEVVDVENLRRHYARTLQCWSEAFEARTERLQSLVDDKTWRVWRMYLVGSQWAFEHDEIALFQVLCRRAGQPATTLPWSRRWMYESAR